jgi:hypothetical protein
MPIKDADGPFIASTVGFLGAPPGAIQWGDNDDKIVEILKKTNSIPLAAVVNPFPGYHHSLMAKFNKIKTMIRAKCLLDGSNVQYPDRDDINLPNEVWQRAMEQAIAHAVISAVLGGWIIDSIRIIFDGKSMNKKRRILFEKSLDQIGKTLREYLGPFEKKYPPKAVSVYKDRIRLLAGSISVYWGDESNPSQCEFGLKLADNFARKMYHQLINQDQAGFETSFRKAGFKDIVLDITELVIRPLDKNIIDRWKRDTGLPEPQV